MRKSYHRPAPPPKPIRAKLWVRNPSLVEHKLREEIAALKAENERLRAQADATPKRGWLDRIRSLASGDVEPGFKVSREDAFAALDSERQHMDRIGHAAQPVSTYMLLMEHYTLKARDEWACSKKPVLDELDNLRKVGALVVACLEAHGAPPRVKSKANPIPGQPDKHASR